MGIYAVVRVRGRRKRGKDVMETLKRLRLHKSNHCVIVRDEPSVLGMLKKVESFITYGPVSEETLVRLIEKRAEVGAQRFEGDPQEVARAMMEDPKALSKWNISPVFRLKPPRKGWKSTKKHFPDGALGRRPEMDSLLRRMI